MNQPRIATRAEWLEARKALLAEEKAFTSARDALSARRRTLPWVEVEKTYTLEGPNGRQTLTEVFGPSNQLIVYHFMYGPEWEEPCPLCSFWADNFDRLAPHLAARDTAFVAISSAPYPMLKRFRERLDWQFTWLSSAGTTFNQDFGVSPHPGKPLDYNFGKKIEAMDELPGVSVFARGKDEKVYHTYSCYSRGLDMLNTAYHYLDLTPKGRDEQDLDFSMSWVRYRDRYG